jgi:hypothetical protein
MGEVSPVATAREELHALVDTLPEKRARLLLRGLRTRDAALIGLALAPEDDEPTTPDEDAGAAEALEEYRRGHGRPLAEVRRDLRRG